MELPDNGRRRQARAGRCRSRGHRDNPTSTTKLKATFKAANSPSSSAGRARPYDSTRATRTAPANARAAKSTMAARNARVIDSNTTSWDVTLAIRSEVHTAAAPGTCSIMAAATAEGCAPSFTFTITHEIASKGSTLSQTLKIRTFGRNGSRSITSMKMVSSTLDPVGSRVPTVKHRSENGCLAAFDGWRCGPQDNAVRRQRSPSRAPPTARGPR